MKRLATVSAPVVELRRIAALIAVLSLLFSTAVVRIDIVAAASEQSQNPTAKRPLTHQDYDSWRSIQAPQISRDGKFVAYAFLPQDGDGDVVVRNVSNGVEWRATRGYRPPVPPPDDPGTNISEFQAAQGRLVRPLFTADSKHLIFAIEPTKADLTKAKKEKKKPEEMPKNAMGIMDLANGSITRIERVKNFQVPEDGSGFIAYLLEAKPEEKPTSGNNPAGTQTNPSSPPGAAAPKEPQSSSEPARTPARQQKKKEYGSDLTLRNMSSGSEQTLNDVLDYSISKDARALIFTVSAKNEESNGIFAIRTDGQSARVELLRGKGRYQKLTWDEENLQLAFISDRDDVEAKQPKFKLYYWSRTKTPEAGAIEIAANTSANLRKDSVVSEKANLSFSLDGSRLFFGTAPPPEPEKNADEELPADEKVVVDLWHWKDDYVQPIQRVRAEQERNRSYRAVYDIANRKLVQLADETMENISPSLDGRVAIGTDNRSYRVMNDYDPGFNDVYLINTTDGSRKPIAKNQRGSYSLSPNAKYALYFDGKDWNSYSVADGRVVNLTRNLPVAFYNELNDTPQTPGSYGIAGWTLNDREVLIYDRFDIWQIAPDGSSAKTLTDGVGRKEKIELRYVRLDPKERAIDPGKPLLLSGENEETRESSFYRDKIGGSLPERLLLAAKNFNNPTKARDADVLMFSASRFDEFPDLWVSNLNLKDLKRVSDGDAQRRPFKWGTAELVAFTSTDGISLKGLLFKPDNFDPKRKYPMIVYIYERLSQSLHSFRNPAPGTSINPTFYVSNNYLVFMPDIAYTVGYPGPSALKCVLPAIQEVIDRGFVDEKAIGIQGHSWGGYQIAYMVTQTNRFRAAAPGALVSNMTSAYSGIRWGTGLPRQFQYERTQSRIGGSLWEYPLRFLDNSPVFRADKVTTPLLMLHNDEDDAVPWYQGIEFYLALRRLGKQVYMFNYNGEKHGLRKRINQKDYTHRMQEFFDHFLKGAPAAEWIDKGIPYLQREKEKERYRATDVPASGAGVSGNGSRNN